MQPETILSMHRLSFKYPNSKQIFEEISCSIKTGEMISIVGPNGSGKSTLIKLLCGLLIPTGGEIYLKNRLLSELSPKAIARVMAYVPQRIVFSSIYSVEDIIRMGRYAYRGVFTSDGASDKKIVDHAMATTKVQNLKQRFFDSLSGGERQRVIIASALAQEPTVLLLDEPSASLDIYYQLHLFHLLKDINRKNGITIIAAVHDINIARWFFPRTILLDHSLSIDDGMSEKILSPPNILRVFKIKLNVFFDTRADFSYYIPDFSESDRREDQ